MRRIAAIGLLAALAGCAGADERIAVMKACRAEQGMSLTSLAPGWGWGGFGPVGVLIQTQDSDYIAYTKTMDECKARKAAEVRT